VRAELAERAQQAVEQALEAGADDVWAVAQQSRDVEFSYRDGALEKVQDATSRNLLVQVYAKGRYSSHRTTDLNPDRLGSFLAQAVASTAALEPDPYRAITPPELFNDRPEANLDLVDDAVAKLEREQRLDWCMTLDAAARNHEKVISATAGVYDGSAAYAIASSNGFKGFRDATYCWLGTSVTLKDRGDRRASDGFYAGGTHVADLPGSRAVAETALDRALARLDADKGPTTRTTMLVDSRAASSLVGRFLQSAYARSVQQGRSFWSNLHGKKAFSEKLTLIDDPLIRRGLGSRLFDEEGIAARPVPLVEAGIVRNIYVDTYYGGKAEMQPTTGSPSNVTVGTGKLSLEELVAEVGEGIYVTSWLGGNADDTTGDFSLGLRGHVVENGVIGRPVGEMNVTGNLRKLFGQLELMGDDVYPYATILSPSLVFTGVDFSGA
jgi:PmbA protein